MSEALLRNASLVDRELARRLERAEALANAALVETRARLFPDSGARWIQVAGAHALFDGPYSPLTQTFGLGLFDPATDTALAELEAFFHDRGAAVVHEVSPLADPEILPLLTGRGYRPVELSSVLFQPILLERQPAGRGGPGIRVRPMERGEADLWAATSARGWGERPELAEFMRDVGAVIARTPGTICFFAELNGMPVGTGALVISDGTAFLAGASTVPAYRRQGAQGALLDARLRYAMDLGCDLGMLAAQPGSASQLNAERQGFRIAYTRIKWRLD